MRLPTDSVTNNTHREAPW